MFLAITPLALLAYVVPELAAKSKLLRKELLSQVLPIRNGLEARLPGPFSNRNGPKTRLSVRPVSEPKRAKSPSGPFPNPSGADSLFLSCTAVNKVSQEGGGQEHRGCIVQTVLWQEVKGSLAQAAASTQELVHIRVRCWEPMQVLAGFPVPKCDKTLREFRNRCILLFYAWDQEELTRRLLSFVTTQKHRDVFSLFVSACLRVSALQQALVQAAGAETLACLEYLTEHTQGGKPWTVASVGAYLADRSTSTGWPLLLAREPVLVDECGLCIAPNPATGGLDLQTLAMLVQGDMIILGSRTFRHKLRLDEQWRQHAQAQEQGDLHAQGDLSAFLQGVQVGGWNACDPLVPALYNARTTVMSLLGYEPQPVLIIARTVHPQEFIYVNYGSAFWEEQGPL
eukprot:g27953.t1